MGRVGHRVPRRLPAAPQIGPLPAGVTYDPSTKKISGTPSVAGWGSDETKDFTVTIEAKDLQIGYDCPLTQPLNLTFERNQKVAIIGANGIGKTTLLKSLLGIIPPIAGEVERGDYLELGYFEQETASGNRQTPLEAVWDAFPSLNQAEVRAALARCGLTSKHIESQIQVLSGGEQAKVRLCLLMNRENNVLVLDEPTNHLDVDAKDEIFV